MIWWRRFIFRPRISKQVNTSFPRVYISQKVADATAKVLTSFRSATEQHEGIAYWAGITTDTSWTVTTVIAPVAHTTPGSYQTSAVANAEVISMVNQYDLRVLAQVHGHPGAWVEHSQGDELGAFMPYPGFYSIVVPHYGIEGLLPLTACGIYRFYDNEFQELFIQEVEQIFVVVPHCIDLRRK